MSNEHAGPVASVPSRDHPDVTTLLLAWQHGDDRALHQLIPLVERHLRRSAQQAISGERPDDSLQATALVNEVYLRLVDIQRVSWNNRAHFLALTARLMRRILVDRARTRNSQRRGGTFEKVELDDALADSLRCPQVDLVSLDDALELLAKVDQRRSQVVELRFFGGLEVEETAEVLGVSRATVVRDWALARAWLFRELAKK